MDLRGQHEDATEVNEWIKFGMRIAVSVEWNSKLHCAGKPGKFNCVHL